MGDISDNIEQSIKHGITAINSFNTLAGYRGTSEGRGQRALAHLCLARAYNFRVKGLKGDNVESLIMHNRKALENLSRSDMPINWAHAHLGTYT
jgi:hypothetical protein